MLTENEVMVNGSVFKEISVSLPKTTLLIITNEIGFVMCGALNVDIYNTEKMKDRKVLCANAVGVKNFDELLNARINNLSQAFEELGAFKGMRVRDALSLLA